MVKRFIFSCILFQKVKLSYISDSLHVKENTSIAFLFFLFWRLELTANESQYLEILEYLHLSFNKWPYIQYKLWVSLVLLNHNNGEHCWLGNGPEDDHWHQGRTGTRFQAGKSHTHPGHPINPTHYETWTTLLAYLYDHQNCQTTTKLLLTIKKRPSI